MKEQCATPVLDEGTEAVDEDQRAEERRRALAERMSQLHISRSSELPRLDLYLDQLLSFVSQELSFMQLPDEGPLVTGSMVNNYVKLHVLPAPIKHRYTRKHVAVLICVCAFKRVFSISQVAKVVHMVSREDVDEFQVYDELCSALECSLAEQFAVSPEFVVPAVEPEIHLVSKHEGKSLTLLERTLEASVVSLASKIYVDQLLATDSTDSSSN
ncbi:MAG: DUF1836 domain-containing protein [Tractidigestivibacter sp.]|jgi:hypothetical protein|uniref:DUF1836 domain-containing protein n=1 Tax=Tractidigestivibacter sp. TaxID=2847320 RepID=UPI003D8FB320